MSDKPLRELFMLRPGIVFLNHGSFGACPRPVFEAYQNWQVELEREPVEFLGRRFPELMHNARRALSRYLRANHEDIIFTPNATTAINQVARALPLQPGDEVLASDQEYGAMDRTWDFVCRKRGARYIRQPISLPVRSKDEIVEDIWAGVTDKTRVLFVSHITAVTALILPIEELARRARDAGILMMVDGAHAPGQLALNLETLGVDFYAGNCHKWMMAPKGAGFLYVRPDRQALIEPLVVSWGDKSLGSSQFIQENEYQGTRDLASFLSVPAAIEFMHDHDWPEVQQRCHELVLHFREIVTEITGVAPLSPAGEIWFRQMVALPLPEVDGERLNQRLFDEFSIEIPVNEINGKQYIRVSVQGYNSAQDIAKFADAFHRLFPEMVR